MDASNRRASAGKSMLSLLPLLLLLHFSSSLLIPHVSICCGCCCVSLEVETGACVHVGVTIVETRGSCFREAM